MLSEWYSNYISNTRTGTEKTHEGRVLIDNHKAVPVYLIDKIDKIADI